MYNADLLKAIIENVVDGIFVIDQDGTILLANPSACKLFGYDQNELLKYNINLLMPSPDRENHHKYIKRYEQTGQAHVIGTGRQIQALRKDGTLFPARLAVSAVKYKTRTVYTGVIHDLSAEKEAEQKITERASELEMIVSERTNFLQNIIKTLEQAKEEVNTSFQKEKELSKLKSRFVSIASHEFRTPLSAIQLSASLIEHYFDKLDKQKIFNHINKIKLAVKSLTDTLNEFLSIERIENGQVNPVYREFDLNILCDEIIDAMRPQLKDGQLINFEPNGHEGTVLLDSNMVQHILINLLSNAIKYSGNDGKIKLAISITEEKCCITIRDNGIGIPPDDQARLFSAFFRAANTGDIEGTGLGLHIVKLYVEKMKGNITLTSRENFGTAFKIVFPCIK